KMLGAPDARAAGDGAGAGVQSVERSTGLDRPHQAIGDDGRAAVRGRRPVPGEGERRRARVDGYRLDAVDTGDVHARAVVGGAAVGRVDRAIRTGVVRIGAVADVPHVRGVDQKGVAILAHLED